MSKRPSKSIFRSEALDQLSSPEQLDQLLQVVSRKSWLPLLGMAAVIIMALIWSVAGTIPITVEGAGQLHYKDSLRSLPSPAAGRIASLGLVVDEEIEMGQELGKIDQPDLRQRLEQENVRRDKLEKRFRELLKLREKRRKNETKLNEENRKRLTERTEATAARASNLKKRSEEYFSELKKTLAKLTTERDALGKDLKARLDKVLDMIANETAQRGEELKPRNDFLENKTASDDIRLRIQQIELSRIGSVSLYERQMELVAELKAEKQALDVEEEKSEALFQEFKLDNELSISEADGNIKRIKEQLSSEGQVSSVWAGRVIEVTGTKGQFVEEGQRLATIRIEIKDGPLIAYAYFDVKDGKKIDEDDVAHVTPTTVKRERYGSIIGRVTAVSDYPVTTEAVQTHVGNAEVARRLTAGGDKIEVTVELKRSTTGEGFEWTSGKDPEIDISAGMNVTVRINIEQRTPISFVIPILRQWSGS
ncbi:MAG: NHLP bacteriocin system secretion protein [Planctomycetes bacterium]|nr:NHLP bacteriocin system secretion protein [Planctomycetota bacterium]